jgi:hypothetical protein
MTATLKDTEEQSIPISNRSKAAQAGYTPKQENIGGRKPAVMREQAFNALAWLVDGATGVVEELRHGDLGLSEEFWIHMYAARRESLLAARAAIDSLLAQTEAESVKAADKERRKSRRGSVKVT